MFMNITKAPKNIIVGVRFIKVSTMANDEFLFEIILSIENNNIVETSFIGDELDEVIAQYQLSEIGVERVRHFFGAPVVKFFFSGSAMAPMSI